MLHPDKAERQGQTLRLSSQIVHMVAPDQLKDELLPTPSTIDGKPVDVKNQVATRNSPGLQCMPALLGMPEEVWPETDMTGNAARQVGEAERRRALLPTPKAGDAEFGLPRTTGRPPEKSTHLATRLHYTDFGHYTPAIERWEAVLGREAPAPTEPTAKGKQRLSAAFVEWLMGQSQGWVTDPGLSLSRAQQLRCLGNGVVTQQAVYALNWLIHRADHTTRRAA